MGANTALNQKLAEESRDIPADDLDGILADMRELDGKWRKVLEDECQAEIDEQIGGVVESVEKNQD